jgi:integral membrane sensor domain MASE1
MKGYPRWFVPALIAAMLLMLLSGALLAPTTLALRGEVTLPWRLAAGARIGWAAAHAAGGFALLMLVGALWSIHMRSGWRRRRQRASGLMLGMLLLALAASSVVIYYAGDEAVGTAAAFLHLGLGVVLVLPFGWHWLHGRRRRET